MPKFRNDLVWTNININDMGEESKAAAQLFYESKQGLEQALLDEAMAHGVAKEGDSIKISTTKYPVIGVAIVKGSGARVSSGWGALQAPPASRLVPRA